MTQTDLNPEVQVEEIFKVQRCLVPPDGPVLIYNKDRSIQTQLNLPLDVILHIFRDVFTVKVYIKGYLGKDHLLHISEILDEWPEW